MPAPRTAPPEGVTSAAAAWPLRHPALLAAALAAAVFAGTLANRPVLDDGWAVLENPLVRSLDVARIFAKHSGYAGGATVAGTYRPLATLTCALQRARHGPAAVPRRERAAARRRDGARRAPRAAHPRRRRAGAGRRRGARGGAALRGPPGPRRGDRAPRRARGPARGGARARRAAARARAAPVPADRGGERAPRRRHALQGDRGGRAAALRGRRRAAARRGGPRRA